MTEPKIKTLSMQLAELNTALAERDSALAEKDTVLAEKDREITELIKIKNTVSEKDAEIAALKEKLVALTSS